MPKFTLIRLGLALALCAAAAGLIYSVGDRMVLGVAAVAAAVVAVPVLVAGSVLWGPTGLAARFSRQGTYRFKSIPRTIMLAVALIAVGSIPYAHFAFSPTAGFLGFLLLDFAAERRLLTREFEQARHES